MRKSKFKKKQVQRKYETLDSGALLLLKILYCASESIRELTCGAYTGGAPGYPGCGGGA